MPTWGRPELHGARTPPAVRILLISVGARRLQIPALGDVREDFQVALLDRAPEDKVAGGSKAVGEPPFMLSTAVVAALRHALSAYGDGPITLASPATPEAILRAVYALG